MSVNRVSCSINKYPAALAASGKAIWLNGVFQDNVPGKVTVEDTEQGNSV